MLLQRETDAYDNDENDKDDKNNASRPDDEKVPEVRSRLKLDGTLTAAHLFPQIDPEMVLDGKGVKRYRKYRKIPEDKKGSSNFMKTNVPKI